MKHAPHVFALGLLLCCGCRDYCISQCVLLGCDERILEEFPDYEETLAEWQDTPAEYSDASTFMVAGECGDSQLFLYRCDGAGQYSIWYVFNADEGNFIGMRSAGGGFGAPCGGLAYWPRKVDCANAVVTEVFYGAEFEVGARAYWYAGR